MPNLSATTQSYSEVIYVKRSKAIQRKLKHFQKYNARYWGGGTLDNQILTTIILRRIRPKTVHTFWWPPMNVHLALQQSH